MAGDNNQDQRLELSRTRTAFQMAGGLRSRAKSHYYYSPLHSLRHRGAGEQLQAAGGRAVENGTEAAVEFVAAPHWWRHIRLHGQPQPSVGHAGFILETIRSRAFFAIVTTGKTRADKRPGDCRASAVTARPAAGLARRDQATHGSRA